MADETAGEPSVALAGSESPKEDAATKATREELKHAAISDKQQHSAESKSDDAAAPAANAAVASTDRRATTPEPPATLVDKHDETFSLREQVSSPKKKRAHDEVDADDNNSSRIVKNVKNTSRDETAGNSNSGDDNGLAGTDADVIGGATNGVDGVDDSAEAAVSGGGGGSSNGSVIFNRSDRAEPEKKRLRDKQAEQADRPEKSGNATETAKDIKASKDAASAPTAKSSSFAASGFAKLTSSVSPFGSFGDKAPNKTNSSFLGSFSASSSASPFGALSAGTAPAATIAAMPTTSTAQKAPSSLGTAPSLTFGGGVSSPFASLGSSTTTTKGFGNSFGGGGSVLGGGFGGFGGFGGLGSANRVGGGAMAGPRLSTFANPGEVFKSDKPARPFGAPASDADESEEDADSTGGAADDEEAGGEPDGDEASGDVNDADERPKGGMFGADEKKKPRLQRVAVDDGEAGEATILQVRARMYHLDKDHGGWKERGGGMLKLNVPEHCVEFDHEGIAIPASFDASTLGLEEDGDENDATAEDNDEERAAGDDTDAKSDTASPSAPLRRGGAAAAAESGAPKRSVVRLIMRQDSTHKVLLNTVVLPVTVFQERQTLKSTTVLFTAFEGEDAKPVNVQMKMNIANAKTFLATMEGIQRELRGD